MKTVAEVIGVSRSNLVERLQERPKTRIGRPPLPDEEVVAEIKTVIAELPTYGYRRVHAILKRRARATGRKPPNHKRVYRVMKAHGLLLDRHVGAELVEYLLSGTLTEFDAQRLQNSTTLLYNDLLRQGLSGVEFQRDVAFSLANHDDVELPILAVTNRGERFAIALSGPLTTDHPAASSLSDLVGQSNNLRLILVNELLVRGNLPAATRDVRERLGV